MSPIKGLSEQRRLPRIGKIAMGYKDPAKNMAPTATDYFVLPKDNPHYAELVERYGAMPRQLPILFLVEDESVFASQFYRCYSRSRGLLCKGDGMTANCLIDLETGAMANKDSQHVKMQEVACAGRDCPDYKVRCKEMMALQFVLPEISGLGIWQLDTSSVNSIRNINGAIDLIRAIYGRIHMVPVLLAMEQIEVVNPDDEKRRKKKVWVLNLRSTDNMIQAAIKSRLKPSELVTGIYEAESGNLPNPDDEVPDLVTPAWEKDKPDAESSSGRTTAFEADKAGSSPASARAIAAPGDTGKKAEKKAHDPADDVRPEDILDLNSLEKKAHALWKIQPVEVYKRLGYGSKTDCALTPWACFQNLREVMRGT